MNFKKAIFISPLIGGIFSGCLFWAYSVYLIFIEMTTNQNDLSIISFIQNILFVLPVILFITILFSYILFYPCYLIKELINKKITLSEKQGWFVMFLIGTILSSIIIVFFHNEIIKSIIIFLSMSFGLTFNSSLLSILSGKISTVNKV